MYTPLYYKTMPSPVGRLTLVTGGKGLRALSFDADGGDCEGMERQDNHFFLKEAEKQLEEYFHGRRRIFALALDMRGSVFQIRAWRELQKIPYGETISYGEQAARLGDTKKARAVGGANSRNPLPIVVPCHRVIGASGGLTGFSCGLKIKEYLLRLEREMSRKAA